MNISKLSKPALLIIGTAAIAVGLGTWKGVSIANANAAAQNHPEPMEVISAATAE